MRDVEEVDPSVRVLVRDLGGAPHIVTFGAGSGIVGFTTFHHGAQLTEEMKRSLVFLISRL